MLDVQQVSVHYGAFQALHEVSLQVPAGKVVSLVGANGAGKTTLINTISGLLKPSGGAIFFEGQDLTRLSGHQVAGLGLAQIPEGRKIFPEMTVYENLLMGGYSAQARKLRSQTLEEVYTLFPRLRDRHKQLARTLSGGEQQMLVIGRALMMRPKLMMFDEPSLGLAPLMVKAVFEVVVQLKARGMTILLVEQNVRQSLRVADYAYVLESGQIVLEGESRAVLENEHTRRAFLGL
ncbi:MAG TPA: branched-chain amino acid ABC transporter ATP-binding protein [Chloroflexi bacterium]|nr:branched-chain amino acid ABC transporter ATP-binding protein [Chloroflexota bacterium]HHW86048.1 ABC transporter ATP-binding protein [Chloroflexota bacterium]